MTRYFIKAMASRLTATVSSLGYGLISLHLYGEYLNKEAYGVVVVAMQFLAYLPLFDGGFRTSTCREILATRDEAQRARLIGFTQRFYTGLGMLVVVVAVGLMSLYAMTPVARELGEPLTFFQAMGFFGALAFFNSQQAGLLTGLGAQPLVFLLASLNSWVNVAMLWVCLRHGLGVWAFPIATGTAFVIGFPVTLTLVGVRVPGFRFFDPHWDEAFREHFLELRGQAWRCFRSQVSIMFLFTWDIVLVGVLCGAGEAGVYGVLSRVFHITRGFLQSAGDVSWPLVAKQGTDKGEFTGALLRVNAWMQGAVMGGIAFTVLPFLAWYMGHEWTASTTVLALMIARFMITGLSSPASYFLIGLGRFRELAARTERELAAACVLAVFLGMVWGVPGVAVAFLMATVFGSLTPILGVYVKDQGKPLLPLLAQLWWRALAGFGLSGSVAFGIRNLSPSGAGWVLAGAASVLVALMLATLVAWLKGRGLPLAASRGERIAGFLQRF